MTTATAQEQLDRIEEMCIRILHRLGADGADRLPSEIKRQAAADFLKYQARRDKRKDHERANEKR